MGRKRLETKQIGANSAIFGYSPRGLVVKVIKTNGDHVEGMYVTSREVLSSVSICDNDVDDIIDLLESYKSLRKSIEK